MPYCPDLKLQKDPTIAKSLSQSASCLNYLSTIFAQKIEAAIPPPCSQGNRRKRALFLVALALIPIDPLVAQGLSTKVAQYMNAQVKVNHFAGSILVAQRGTVLVTSRYGLANPEKRSQETPDKRYRLGSIAKQFTAMAILQLREKGKLQLQDSVCNYIRECPTSWQEITIRGLLTQTDGIPEVTVSSDRRGTILPETEASEVLTLLRDKPVEYGPGRKINYGNSGYAVLAAVIEDVSGGPYLKYLKDHIFIPLGMSDTGYDDVSQRGAGGSPPFPSTSSITPSDLAMARPYVTSRLYSTVEDLYRWDRALYTEQLVSKQSVDEMFSPRVDGYGFGWVILKEFDRAVDTESGGLNLLASSIRRYPDEQACVIVLSNLDYVDAGRISRDLAAILFGKHYELPTERHGVIINPAVYNSYVGQYETARNFRLMVTREGDHLMIRGTGQEEVELLPESETRFFVNGPDAEVTFVKGLNGDAAELILQQGGRDIPALRVNPKP